jgi:hypothetical protein
MQTKDLIPTLPPKILLIGHDPRLQNSDTQASVALFADYFFRPVPTKPSEKRKFGLAKAAFDMITWLTNGKYKPEEVYITNLCNNPLSHAPKGKIVYIPQHEAETGVAHIKEILQSYPSIEYIFPMSLQVNYWLQKLDFYDPVHDFLSRSEPKAIGINSMEPYYQPCKSGAFLLICGNRYKTIGYNQTVVPVLHVKNYPLNNRFSSYLPAYSNIRQYFQSSW